MVRGTYYYRVMKDISVMDREPTPEQLQESATHVFVDVGIVDDNRKLPTRVFEDETEPDCCICLYEPKALIIVPCGHFCICRGCCLKLKASFGGNKCPLCRNEITSTITPDEMQ